MAHYSKQLSALRKSRLGKKIGGAVFGLLLGGIVTSSIYNGLAFIFREEAESWGLAFWGTHHVTRVLAGLIGVGIGSFVAGCIAKDHGGRWGLISALPRIGLWIIVAFLGVHATIQKYIIPLTIGHWIVIAVLIPLIPFVAYYTGKAGQETRVEHEEFFENRKGTLLGIKWYHWLWLFFPINITGVLATASIFQIIAFFFLIVRSLFWFLVVGDWVATIIGGGLYLLGRSMYETYNLLALGHQRGLTNRKIAKHIALWLVGAYLGVSLLQLFADWILAKL
ncbi:MAG TPA: hypothetical protein ENI23_12100 [bacterium]|nr:hypothetical protein [bacterium]